MLEKNINAYEVIRPLGQGTFGQTWLARKNGNEYALKLFRNEMIRSKNDIKRIDREIQALKMVDHPNVIKYVDDGEYTEGFDSYRYLVMEYADGEPLNIVIENKRRLAIAQAQKYAIQILEGLKSIHDAGLLHRDLKPGNIFITRMGEVRILDFGLVKLLDASTLTATGVGMGTYAYMAPEQLQDSKNIDYRADLYSVGAILFHMITGRYPFEIHSLVEAPYKILNEIPPFASTINPAVPVKLENIIATLLEKETHRRKYSIEMLYAEMQDLTDKTIVPINEDLTLRFLPRLLHNERTLVESHNEVLGLDGIVFPANYFPKYRAVFDTIRDTRAFTVIDPVVYKLSYSKFSNTQSLVSLPYVISQYNKEKPEDFKGLAECQNRAKLVIDWQAKQNPSVLVAPFHFLSSVNDLWLDVDLKVFNECRKYINDISEDRPLYAGISIQIESLTDDLSVRKLVNNYSKIQTNGYLIMLDAKLDSFNKAHYYAFAKLVNMLGELNKPIILSRVNDYGLGLMAFGATAISSGIGYIESFDEAILIEEGGNYTLKPKFYIPQLLTSYSENALKDIFEPAMGKELACECPYCKGSIDVNYLLTPKVAKGHYLYQKTKQVELLNSMAPAERFRWFINTLSKAEEEAKALKKASKSKYIETEYFKFWRDTLIQVNEERRVSMELPSASRL